MKRILKKVFRNKGNDRNWFLYFILVIYVSSIIIVTFQPFGEQHFTYLSLSFLKGCLNLNGYPLAWNDTALFGGNRYFPPGPFPALAISPLVFIGNLFGFVLFHHYIHWILVLGIFLSIYKLARVMNYNPRDSFFWAFAFNMGSPFVLTSLLAWSWHFSQALTVLLILLSLYEFLTRRRFLIIGLLCAAVFATRTTAVLGMIYFIMEILLSKEKQVVKLQNIGNILIPVLIAGIFLSFYNFQRFNSLFESGYSYQQIDPILEKARSFGLFNFAHIPGNLYFLFFASPVQVFMDDMSKVLRFPFVTYDEWGLGIFYTSPYLLTLFTYKFKKVGSKLLLLTTFVVLVPILMYYGIGVRQFGYRYILDLLPYVFLLMMKERQKPVLSSGFRLVVLFSIMFNVYLLSSINFM